MALHIYHHMSLDHDEWLKKRQQDNLRLIHFLSSEVQSQKIDEEEEEEEDIQSVDEDEEGEDIKSMSYEKLQEYESELEGKLQKVREEKDMRYQREVLCVICQINVKNVCILGCNHLDLCEKCEAANCNITKYCLTCFKPYQKIVVIKR